MNNEDSFYLNWGYSIADQGPIKPLSFNPTSGTSTGFYSFPSKNHPPHEYACPDCQGYGDVDGHGSGWAPNEPCTSCQGTGIMAIPLGEFWG